MAKISINKTGEYATSGGGEFFTLKDDGDLATVRFLYDEKDGSDMDYFLVHEVKIDGKRKYINCLGVDDEGRMHPNDCPLCKAGNKPKEKLFLQLIDTTDNKLKVWERGQQFVPKIVSFINRYGSLVSREFEVERRGKKGDQKTSYEMFPLEQDNKTLEDFPQKNNLIGGIILEVTPNDMYDIMDGVYRLPNKENEQTGTQDSRQSRSSRDNDQPARRNRREQADRDAF